MCAGDLLSFRGEVFRCGDQKVRCIVCYCLAQNFTMSGPHYFTVRRRRVIEHTATEYLSPIDVEELCTDILDAGLRLASLLTAYPRADLVGEALSAVTEVVEAFSLEGKWVTSWASSAKIELVATSGLCVVSGSVTFSNMTCKSRVVHWSLLCRLLCRR